MITTFRRSSTAAPLKLPKRRTDRGRRAGLPPFIDGGPIEALGLATSSPLQESLPPFIDGGPIEASTSHTTCRNQGFLPPFIDGGPIEALS